MKYNHLHIYTIFHKIKPMAYITVITTFLFRVFPFINDVYQKVIIYIIVGGIAAVYICLVAYQYTTKRIYIRKNSIRLHSMMLTERCNYIRYKNVCLLHIHEGLLMKIFRVFKVYILSYSVNMPTSNGLYLGKAQVKKLKKSIFKDDQVKVLRSPSPLEMLLMCISMSNPSTALLVVVPFIKKIETIIGGEVRKNVYKATNIKGYLVSSGISPILASIINIILLLTLISLVLELLKYWHPVSQINEKSIDIHYGILPYTNKIVSKSNIDALYIIETLFTRLFKLKGIYMCSVGIKARGEKSSLIAVSRSNKGARQIIWDIMNIKNSHSIKVYPKKNSFGYIIFPLLVVVASLIGSFFALNNEIIFTVFLICIFYSLWFFIICVYAQLKSSIKISGNIVIISGRKGLSFVEGYVRIDKIRSIVIKQNPLQQISGKCNICIYIYSGNRNYFSVKHLMMKNVENIVETVNNLRTNSQ